MHFSIFAKIMRKWDYFRKILRSVLLLLRAEERKGTQFWRDFFSSRKTG
jgi:hypothetical protein